MASAVRRNRLHDRAVASAGLHLASALEREVEGAARLRRHAFDLSYVDDGRAVYALETLWIEQCLEIRHGVLLQIGVGRRDEVDVVAVGADADDIVRTQLSDLAALLDLKYG